MTLLDAPAKFVFFPTFALLVYIIATDLALVSTVFVVVVVVVFLVIVLS